MYRFIIPIIITIILSLFIACDFCEEGTIVDDILGCTDSLAYNYDPDATKNDGSCDYCTGESGSSFILITYDGGLSWDRKCFNIPVSNIIDISIVDSNNIWVCTTPTYGGQTKAQILHSDNGGYTWLEQYVDEIGKFFNYIEFFDELNGIAMGDGSADIPLILKTIDGGQTWVKTTIQPIGEYSADLWRKIDFVSSDYGFFKPSGGISSSKLYRTIDGGYIWNETNYSGYAMVIKFYNEYIGLIIDSDGIKRTADGGSTWNVVDHPNGFIYGVAIEYFKSNPNYVWMWDSRLHFSNDSGINWTQQIIPGLLGVNDLYSGETILWTVSNGHTVPLYYKEVNSDSPWNTIQLPLSDNKVIEGIIDGVGDNIIVIPGHYID